MCGIVGYVGSQRAAEYVLDGLRKLEYRGYDSAGIATLHDGKILLRRRKGKLQMLQDLLRESPLLGNIAIGHTRWATHGRPSDENAHPHHVDDVVLVHNGIIENFSELTQSLQAAGRHFASETDTEIIAHLIALAPGETLQARVRHALAQVRGAYAIAVLSTRQPDTLVVAKNASPLIMGVAEGFGIIASDIPALLPYTRDIVVLNEAEIAVIRAGFLAIETLSGTPVQRAPRTITWSPVMAEKGGHKHFMHKEIYEQPRSVADTLVGRLHPNGCDVLLDADLLQSLAKAARVTFTACGTSYHACLVGRLALEELARLHCDIDVASELRYRHPLMDSQSVLLAVSQSGETADTLAAVKAAQNLGCAVAAVVNVIDSSIAREARWALYTHAGPEIGVASTKAFVTQVLLLILLAIGVARQRQLLSDVRASELLDSLRQLPLLIEEVLAQEPAVLAIAHKIKEQRTALFIGRGYGYPTAIEGALKLKEISYMHAEGYAAGELKHGPIALIEAQVPVIAVATVGPLYEKVLSNMQEVRAREAYVVAVATRGDQRIAKFADDVIYIPPIDPMLAPLLSTIPLQLLSYHVADLRGSDVDQPRNLAKSVTVE